jgi:hypothetical protein
LEWSHFFFGRLATRYCATPNALIRSFRAFKLWEMLTLLRCGHASRLRVLISQSPKSAYLADALCLPAECRDSEIADPILRILRLLRLQFF